MHFYGNTYLSETNSTQADDKLILALAFSEDLKGSGFTEGILLLRLLTDFWVTLEFMVSTSVTCYMDEEKAGEWKVKFHMEESCICKLKY